MKTFDICELDNQIEFAGTCSTAKAGTGVLIAVFAIYRILFK